MFTSPRSVYRTPRSAGIVRRMSTASLWRRLRAPMPYSPGYSPGAIGYGYRHRGYRTPESVLEKRRYRARMLKARHKYKKLYMLRRAARHGRL